MTVSANRETRVRVSASGFSNPIQLDQFVEQAAHVEVYADTELMTLGVDYTLAGIADDAGLEVTITPTGLDDYDPTYYVVFHNPPVEQESDLSLGGRFGIAYEGALDALARRVQTMEDKVKRALGLAIDTDLAFGDFLMPSAVSNALLGWNAGGDALENKGSIPEFATLAAIAADIVELSNISTQLQTLAAISDELEDIYAIRTQIALVAATTAAIVGVYNSLASVATVSGSIGDVNLVAAALANINAVAAALANIATVAGSIASVNTVSGNNANVTTVAANIASINAVAADLPNIALKLNITGSNIGANGPALLAAIGAAALGTVVGVQRFTSSGTYTPTAGTTSALVIVQAAGGGGGGVTNTNTTKRGGSGGAGETRIGVVAVSGSVTITLGSAGGGGAGLGATANNGGAAGDSSYGAAIVAKGGTGGTGTSGTGTNGTTPSGSGGVSIPPTQIPQIASANSFGRGGWSIFGTCIGSILGANLVGSAGEGYGSGGSGACDTSTNTQSGGAGAGGLIFIVEYR